MSTTDPNTQASAASTPPAPRFQFSLKALLIVMTVAGAFLGVAGILFQRRYELSRESIAMSNLKQLGLAMHNHEAAYRALPAQSNRDAAGKPLMSWRVLILPYIEELALYQEFHENEPWDSPHNLKLIPKMPKIYESPLTRSKTPLPRGMTCYLVPAGEGTIFPSHLDGNLLGQGTATGLPILRIEDGTSQTIMLVEASPESAVIWTKPDDWNFEEERPTAGLFGQRRDGFFAAMGDGSVRKVPDTVTPRDARRMFLRNDGQPIDWEHLEGGARPKDTQDARKPEFSY